MAIRKSILLVIGIGALPLGLALFRAHERRSAAFNDSERPSTPSLAPPLEVTRPVPVHPRVTRSPASEPTPATPQPSRAPEPMTEPTAPTPEDQALYVD